jgi:hypothetical protein
LVAAYEPTKDRIVSDWILAPFCIAILFGFVGYALRQGTKVMPDRSNSNFGPSQNDGWSGSSDGGSADGGGHSF